MVTIKTPGFPDNAYLHICSICLRLDGSSLTKIQYLQVEPSEKRTYTNGSMMLDVLFKRIRQISKAYLMGYRK